MKEYSEQEYLQLANEASSFVLSPLGKYLQEQASEHVIDASNGLLNIDPNNPLEITKLQNQVHRYSDSVQWLTDLIATGNTILEQHND